MRMSTSDECILFPGAPSGNGYGYVRRDGKKVLAHREAYREANGTIDPKLQVCHSCDTPLCINPAHLWQGTYGDNARDRAQKGRNGDITGQKNGRSVLTAEMLDRIPDLRSAGLRVASIARELGVSWTTANRAVKKYDVEFEDDNEEAYV